MHVSNEHSFRFLTHSFTLVHKMVEKEDALPLNEKAQCNKEFVKSICAM
jgi:hypothetical protein